MSELSERDRAFQRVLAIKESYQAQLLAKANVVGVGVGLRQRQGQTTEEIALVVMVSEKISAEKLSLEDLIPAQIEDVPVDVLWVGELRATAE